MGHQGYERTMELLRPRVYWPAMYREVRDYISSCERCTMGHAQALHTTSVICLPAVPLKSWQSTLRSLRLLVMGDKMFLFSPMFSRSSTRPYRRATRRQRQWPRCWFTSGSSAAGYPRKSTVTRVGTLSLSWWNPYARSMASRRPGPLHTIPVATRSASDSITRCMICFEPCPRNRSPSGHSTSQSSCRRITIRLTLPPGGAGIAQWLEHRTRDWKVAGSNPCWNGGRIFFSRVDFLCWLLFRYPFHPRVTTVARKKSRSFCQKCRWQVTAKHAYTLRMWILLNRASALVTTCP